MSIYFTVYAGPVLVCKYHMNETVEKVSIKYAGCPNKACKYNNPKHKDDLNKASFCPKCGTPLQTALERVKEKHRQSKSVPHIFELMSEGGFPEDTFTDCWGGVNNEKLIEGHDLFHPSVTDDEDDEFNALLGRKTEFEAREFAIHVRNPDVQGEIAKAEQFLAKELVYLRSKYDSVSVEWMVVTNGR